MFYELEVVKKGEKIGHVMYCKPMNVIPAVGNYIKIKGMVTEHKIKDVIFDYETEIVTVKI